LGKHLILRKERRLQPICVGSPPAVLLRESYRGGGKVKTRTLANLTGWPDAKVDALRRVLKGETYRYNEKLLRLCLNLAYAYSHCGGRRFQG
jgi:hypothetical protein